MCHDRKCIFFCLFFFFVRKKFRSNRPKPAACKCLLTACPCQHVARCVFLSKLMRLCVAPSRAPAEDTLNGRLLSCQASVSKSNLQTCIYVVLFFLLLLSVVCFQPPFPCTRPDTPSWGAERTVSHQNLRPPRRLHQRLLEAAQPQVARCFSGRILLGFFYASVDRSCLRNSEVLQFHICQLHLKSVFNKCQMVSILLLQKESGSKCTPSGRLSRWNVESDCKPMSCLRAISCFSS